MSVSRIATPTTDAEVASTQSQLTWRSPRPRSARGLGLEAPHELT